MPKKGNAIYPKAKVGEVQTDVRDESAASSAVSIGIPVVVRVQGSAPEFDGLTISVSPERIRFATNYVMRSGVPLSLQFRVGTGVCYLNVSGEVISCIPAETDHTHKYLVEIQLAAVREFERRMLQSALDEVLQDAMMKKDALLTIHGTHDSLAEEATRLLEQTTVTHAPLRREMSLKVRATESGPDPVWVMEMKRELKPYWEAVLETRLVQEASTATLSLPQMKGWLLQLYPFIETFPKWIALTIARASDHKTRAFMIDNIRIEKRHAAQWVHMAQGFGVPEAEIFTVEPLLEVEALTHWLWSINTQGSLAEAVAATNYAIEGVTQGIAKLTVQGFPRYAEMPGINLDKRAYAWMENHAHYDDVHPLQALEVMKLYTTRDLEERVIFAARRSLEYLCLALNACYDHFSQGEPAPGGLASRSQARTRMG